MTAVPEAAFLGWKEMREETETELLLKRLLLLLEEEHAELFGLERWLFPELDELLGEQEGLVDEAGDEEGGHSDEEVDDEGDTEEDEELGEVSDPDVKTGRRLDEPEVFVDPGTLDILLLLTGLVILPLEEEQEEEVDPVGERMDELMLRELLFPLLFFEGLCRTDFVLTDLEDEPSYPPNSFLTPRDPLNSLLTLMLSPGNTVVISVSDPL
jgi:hypothetical protein